MKTYRLMIGESRRCYTYKFFDATSKAEAAAKAREMLEAYQPPKHPDAVNDECDGDVTGTLEEVGSGTFCADVSFTPEAFDLPYSWDAHAFTQRVARLTSLKDKNPDGSNWKPTDPDDSAQALERLISEARALCGMPATVQIGADDVAEATA